MLGVVVQCIGCCIGGIAGGAPAADIHAPAFCIRLATSAAWFCCTCACCIRSCTVVVQQFRYSSVPGLDALCYGIPSK